MTCAMTVLLAAFYAFNYGGKPVKTVESCGLGVESWGVSVKTVRDDAEMHKVVREWVSPDKRLTLRSTETEYRKFPVTEYVPELICRGDEPTEIVSDFHTLAFRCPSAHTVLRAMRGTINTDRDFHPETIVLGTGKGETNAFAMVACEGRSSAQWMPWWGVDFEAKARGEGEEGLEIGLGWTGAWRADFTADGKEFAMSAGMVKTHFRLLKGEVLRQPSLLVFRRAKGVAPLAMQTLIHRFMVDVKSPRDRKGELIHGISAITAGGGNKTPAMMKKIIDWKVANQMPFDCFWVDAGWNGPAHLPDLISNCGNMWYNFTGDWRFNPTVHPDGDLGKVADAAHAADMRMLLWMEPERCVSDPPPPVFRDHRDWLLPNNDRDIRNKRQLLVDFGNPSALEWITGIASEHIRRCKLDVFRQDFNLNSLPLWQANDAPDRQGVTEAKHIMGLWKFWDELRERFPHLVIENCASGGRRLDYEAVSRGHSYCRTDYAIFHREPSQITDVQNVTLNTLAYLPFQGSESTPAVFFDDYGIFSSFASGNVFTPSDWNAGIVKNDFSPEQVAWLREVFTIGRRMMPYYEGDFYPLTDCREKVKLDGAWMVKDDTETRWCAWQLHRADQDAGFAIFFRRLNTPSHRFAATLGGIDENADYEVEEIEKVGGEGRRRERMSGRALRKLTVELRSPRSFRLIFYRKVTRKNAALAYGADSDNIDAMISAACAAGGSRTVMLGKNPHRADGVWMLTRAILLPDDFTLVLDDCRVELAPGTRDNLIRNAGALGYRRVTPNHGIRVIGKGNAVLCGGKDNHYAPARSGDHNGWRSMGILFAAVTDYELGGFTMEETQCWGITQENGCARGWVHDIRFNDSNKMRNQDGVDVRKGCHDIVIENISGVTGDDVVALTALRGRDTELTNGRSSCQIGGRCPSPDDDVYNVIVRNIRASCSGGHGIIRLLVQDGIKMHHITVSNVVDTTGIAKGGKRSRSALRIGDTSYWTIKRNEMGDLHHITVADIDSRAKSAVMIKGPLCDATFRNVRAAPGTKTFDISAPLERVEGVDGSSL